MSKIELNILFEIKEISALNTKQDPCIVKRDYSLTECLQDYVTKNSNCKIDFFIRQKDQTLFCTERNYELYKEMLVELKQYPMSEVQKRTGCYPKCKRIHYFYDVEQSKMTWNSNYTSEVFIEPKSSVIEYSNEYYEFDLNDLISSVGGNLGLFLGWSLLSISEALGGLFNKFVNFQNIF